jgi:predicted acylesterase/phospholipase RssA
VSAADASEPAPQPARRPKLGLALSGGGFRAAFFHVGVLARMAERGLLRKVEVISTVSGGSIVGAQLYLHLKDLHENVRAEEITDAHFVKIVEHLETTFLAGVERHVRALAYADLPKNWRMRKANYSRSDRLGELYDEIFYRPSWEAPLFGPAPAPRQDPGGMVQVRDLLVSPAGSAPGFNPFRDNAGREEAPVPILVLNATSLNTGHSWRFEAVRMGEYPRTERYWVEIDKNKRLATTDWEQIAPRQRSFELGLAVAASSCVPGLFHPLAISNLFRYELGRSTHELRVQLVDGGVHDNQGVGTLVDAGCQYVIVSDASGQMADIDEPSTRIPASVTRASSGIYGDRVREEQLSDIRRQTNRSALIHLRKGLPAVVVPPLPDDDPHSTTTPVLHGARSYGVAPRVQLLLSEVRTDLDSFSEVEAHSLAAYGYAMSKVELEVDGIKELAAAGSLDGAWAFARVAGYLERAPKAYLRQLELAKKLFFKPLSAGGRPRLELAIVALLAALVLLLPLALVAYALRDWLGSDVPTWGAVAAVPVSAAVAMFFVVLYLKRSFRVSLLRRLSDYLYSRLSPALLALPLWIAARFMLHQHKSFLAAGRIDALAARVAKESPPKD